MRFLVDAQLPPAVVSLFRRRGFVAVHVYEALPPSANDQAIAAYAVATESVIVTKDEDFAQAVGVKASHPQVVWVRVGNCRNETLLELIDGVLPQCAQALENGERLVEISR
jgi:predicted nuclease of predicted toxin-antitoxin system